jgi:glycosyltransferase involved in cell wall biosynthesis
MRIVYVCNEYPLHVQPGGIGIFTRTIAHGLVKGGHEVTVVGFGKRAGEWDDHGVKVVTLPESKTRGVAWFVNRRRLCEWLKAEARAGRTDIVEIPESHGLAPFSLPGQPTVVRLHLNTSTMARSAGRSPRRLLRSLERMTLSRHRNWIAVSGFVLEKTLGEYDIQPNRSQVIYNPVLELPTDAPVAISAPRDFVLYAGTVSDRKGAYVLATAARSFLADDPNLHLVYVGGLTVDNGRRADETIRGIIGQDLATRVQFTGPVAHEIVLAYMKAARVFAFPSKLEAFSLVPLEAMACGAPVVYSTQHSGPEAIEDGITGLLADPFSPEDVAEKVLRVLNDPALSNELVRNARNAVKSRYSLKRCIDDTLAFYEACISDRECDN